MHYQRKGLETVNIQRHTYNTCPLKASVSLSVKKAHSYMYCIRKLKYVKYTASGISDNFGGSSGGDSSSTSRFLLTSNSLLEDNFRFWTTAGILEGILCPLLIMH